PALLEFLIGDNAYDYGPVTLPRAPHDNRFTKIVLDDDIYEPMEMVILPDLKVLFLERRGKMKMYDPSRKQTRTVAEFDVCIDGNYEDGLHGIALDPRYGKDNHWVYIYYSPSSKCDVPEQYLSRFVFRDDSLHWHTEKVLLKVPVQRETCCHSGGSVEFGPDGLLYLSTGDNTSSKESDGFTPIDERPGRGPFDAQKSSSNTHDLRGKILRIKPEPDGSYSIPDGNLFPKDGSRGRPEIYAMGCRNPFRISIDPETNWLYWGDVGPDGAVDGRYGPQSYDEWNQAKGPGFFGWPYFVADNKAYPDRDFATDEVGPPQDPRHPVNDSPNNTGSRELPPAQPAWIWYPYGPSAEFPLLGEGSRSAMAGPFYSGKGVMPLSRVKFPEYYEGKMFIYEWARSWIMVLTIDKQSGALLKMEPFLPDMPLSKPIELEFGPDGALYVLEYGRQYFMNNPDATLSKIEFAPGNRPPQARLRAAPLAGASPLTVHFSAAESFDYDPEDSTLHFAWHFTDPESPQAEGPEAAFTFDEPGRYEPFVVVSDATGAADKASVQLLVGNEPPNLSIEVAGNRSFFFEPGPRSYSIRITDPEDEAEGGIDPARALVNLSWVGDAEYLDKLRQGRVQLPEGPLQYVEGYRLMAGSDCATCHEPDAPNIGPSYREIARRYAPEGEAVVARLARKVIIGGNGVWGEKIMAGHPQLSEEAAARMVRYILSLEGAENLPLQGSVDLRPPEGARTGGFVLSAAYKDRGAEGIPPLTGRSLLVLRLPRIEAENHQGLFKGLESRFGVNQEFTQVNLKAGGWLRYEQLDLSGVKRLTLRLIHQREGAVELRYDAPDGPLLGRKALTHTTAGTPWKTITLPLNSVERGPRDLYLCFPGTPNTWTDKTGKTIEGDAWHLDWLEFGR
ncbi:MAG: carbohydrate-binding protein, partial [Bacteroidetes bacterium]